MAFEIISTNQTSGYVINDTDTVTLLDGVSLTTTGSAFVGNPGGDTTLESTNLYILGTVSASRGVDYVSGLTGVSNSNVYFGPDAVMTTSGTGMRFVNTFFVYVVNDGTVVSDGTTIFLANPGSRTQIENNGTLNSLTNSTIEITGGTSIRVPINNTGLISGEGDFFEPVLEIEPGYILTNSGMIVARGGNAIEGSVDAEFIYNTGEIRGRIETEGGNDVITNAGLLNSLVALGEGDDRYDGQGGGIVTSVVFGEEGNDTLRGSSVVDRFNGGDGSDLLIGRGGDDELSGGNSPDTILGGDGNDDISGGNQPDVINGNSGDDTIDAGTGNDETRGGSGDDLVDGFTGDDTLRGDSGDDRIIGGDGRDDMYGGSGRDVFIFEDKNDSGIGAARDRIYDFRSGEDTLDISGLAGPAFTYLGTSPFTSSGSPEVRAISNPSGTFIYIDTNGDGARDSDIYLIGTTSVTEGDFLL